MNETIQHIQVPPQKSRERLDVFLARALGHSSRSQIQKLIRDGHVRVNGHPVKPNYSVHPCDLIDIDRVQPPVQDLIPESIPLNIVFEDDHLLVIDKPAGMVVHPANGHPAGTLVNALLGYGRSLSGVQDAYRPGIVHRLDMDTSGLLVVAKNDAVHRDLALQFKDKSVDRQYVAVIWGKPSRSSGTVRAGLGRSLRDRRKFTVSEAGKHAVTHWRILERFPLVCLAGLQLETGRTHQIRVHLASIGHPVFGDQTYGGRTRQMGGLNRSEVAEVNHWLDLMPRQALHARTLGFEHPVTRTRLSFESEPPEDMRRLIDAVRRFRDAGRSASSS